jgi:hypothetical protein
MDVGFVLKSVHNGRFILAQTPENVLFAKPREILPFTCALARREGERLRETERDGERRRETESDGERRRATE